MRSEAGAGGDQAEASPIRRGVGLPAKFRIRFFWGFLCEDQQQPLLQRRKFSFQIFYEGALYKIYMTKFSFCILNNYRVPQDRPHAY